MIRELHDLLVPIIDAVPNVDAYGAGTVPNDPDYPYVVVSFERRGVGASVDRQRLSDDLTGVGWRVETLVVGSTVREAEWVEDHMASVLEGRRLTIDGYSTTPLHFQSSEGVYADPGVENLYVGMSYWTCVSTALQAA